ncbi:MAG: hypothetical protein O2U61_02665 [Candidatus Bathyarchaeota archaeon]|nr:hypothetical protein [Candidatus Bathyarchaeota archaeon]
MPNGKTGLLSSPLLLITFFGVIMFAIVVDTLDLFMEFIGMGPMKGGWGHMIKESFTKSLNTLMDIGTTFVGGGWSFWVSKQGSAGESGSQAKGKPRKSKSQLGKKAAEGVKKTTAKIGTKADGRIGLKVGARTGLSLLGEIIPYAGALPFWTLTVIYTFIKVIRGK